MSILVSSPGHREKVTGNYSRKVNALVDTAIIAIAMLIGIGFPTAHPYAERQCCKKRYPAIIRPPVHPSHFRNHTA